MSAKTKSRLGRGLSSLISISSEAENVEEVAAVPVPLPAPSEVQSTALAPLVDPKNLSASVNRPPPSLQGDRRPIQAIDIALEDIIPNPHQPRRKMSEASIAELASSLKTSGLIQPVVVRQAGDHYELIAGERRWRAAKAAGLRSVLAIVREATGFEASANGTRRKHPT